MYINLSPAFLFIDDESEERWPDNFQNLEKTFDNNERVSRMGVLCSVRLQPINVGSKVN